MDFQEVIFIGLPGLTHHYGGHSPDNMASGHNRGSESSPRQAALQVVALARYLFSLGVRVAILPPQLRPQLSALERSGFTLENAPISALEKASSSSAMWAANAATITPSCDSGDRKMHITAANLYSNEHRRIEAQATYAVLKQLFAAVPGAIVHEPLEAPKYLDEGAANHMRLAPNHGAAALNVFVYGRRQNREASEKIAKTHNIPPAQALFLEQNPDVINEGVFHNDVIAVSNENLLLVHERAYKNGRDDIEKIRAAYGKLHPQNELQIIAISDSELNVEEAVGCYLFNSQIVTRPNGKMTVIAPLELTTLYSGKAQKLMEKIQADAQNNIDDIAYLDLKQSMRNGGGPACLRLRITMDKVQFSEFAQNSRTLVTQDILEKIEILVVQYYPETLTPEALRSPELIESSNKFFSKLEKVLNINL